MTRQTRKRVILGSIAALVLALLVWGFMPDPLPVQAAEVTRGPLEVVVEEEGETQIEDVYVITAPVAAYIRRIDLKEGDHVAAGQPLVELEPPRSQILDPRSRAEAAARVEAARAAVAEAEAAANTAMADRDRLQRLATRGSATPQSAEQAAADAERAIASLEAARAELQAAEAAFALVGGPENLPVLNVIRAPAAGRVLVVHRPSSGHVNPGDTLLEIGNTELLEVHVDVLSEDAVRIQHGTPVVIDQWGGEMPLEAVVTRVEPQGFTRVSALGVEEKRVTVRAELLSAPPALGAGYRVLARFIVWRDDDVLQVPTSTLFRYADGWATFVIENGRARRRVVSIGQQSGLSTQVLEGLQPGEMVIVHPGNEIEDGARVRAEPGT